MTWIEVVDTVAKIGLGALIAAGSSIIIAKVSHERDARQRYAERRRDQLEKILELIIDFDKIYRHQKAAFDNLQIRTPKDKKKNEFLITYQKLNEIFRVSFEVFADISGILLMLGEKDADNLLEKYRIVAYEWYERTFPGMDESAIAKLKPLREQILESRVSLMLELASAYKNE